MRTLPSSVLSLIGALGLLLLLPPAAGAQLRTVVANEIAVSGSEATLRLELKEDEPLVISLRDGEVRVRGEVVGSYARGDALDTEWRSLLGRVIALDDGPLAEALLEWEPGPHLTGQAAGLAAVLDRTLEDALRGPARSLQEALGDRTVLLRVGEQVTVGPGETLAGNLVVVDGTVEVAGTIVGDVVVTRGSARLLQGGRITGDLRVVEGTVEREGGVVEGSITAMRSPAPPPGRVDSRELAELRRELEREIRGELSAARERERTRPSSTVWAPLRNVARGLAGLLENMVTFLVLSLFGVVAVHFAREPLEVVALTARRAPGRAAMVGLAGSFLLAPVYVLGIVVLAVSIVGIPLLLAWIPLFPIALALAAVLGYLAVARNLGEWVAEQRYRGLEWIRGSNALHAVAAGVGVLLVPFVAGNLLRILGLGFLKGLLVFLGTVLTIVALTVGLGAVLLTRGGRIRPYLAYEDYEEVWAQEEGYAGEATGASPGSPSDPEENVQETSDA